MVKKCVIDIGSNTIKLFIAEISDNKTTTLELKRQMVQLGKDLNKNKFILPEIKELAMKVMHDYIDICHYYGINTSEIIVSATAAARIAEDGKDFIDLIRRSFNLNHVKILSGYEEAAFSFLGVIASLDLKDNEPLYVLDVGGGSFQLSSGTAQRFYNGISIPTGANKIAELFGLKQKLTGNETEMAVSFIKNTDLPDFNLRLESGKLTGIGGTIKILQLMLSEHNDLKTINIATIRQTMELLAPKTLEERYQWFVSRNPDEKFREDAGLTKNRAEVFLAGLCIITGILEKLNITSINTSKTDAKDFLIRLNNFDEAVNFLAPAPL